MFKQPITYTDFNGEERTEDFYFHLSSPEIIKLEAELGGTLENHIKTLVGNGNLNDLFQFLEKIILKSYGKKTTDGRSFRKNEELRNEFEYSPAYAEFFEMILSQPDLARKFGEGIADKGKVRKNTVSTPVIEK